MCPKVLSDAQIYYHLAKGMAMMKSVLFCVFLLIPDILYHMAVVLKLYCSLNFHGNCKSQIEIWVILQINPTS